jgi:hypothetical protein
MRKGTLQVPPLRFASVGVTKVESGWFESRGIPPFAENAKDGAPDLWLPVQEVSFLS